MFYRILPLLIVPLLASCSPLPQMWERPVDKSADRFATGMDQYLSSGDISSLRTAAEKDVGGEWGRRAETVVRLDEQVKELNQKIAVLNAQIRDLNDDIDSLTGKLEQQQTQLQNKQTQLQNKQTQLQNKEKQLTESIETKELLIRDNQILEVTLERLKQALIEVGQQPKE